MDSKKGKEKGASDLFFRYSLLKALALARQEFARPMKENFLEHARSSSQSSSVDSEDSPNGAMLISGELT
jgi:hypothetical protein